MNNLDSPLYGLFNTPICPRCATRFDDEQYDAVDDCARCSNCGASYRIADQHRPDHPEGHVEHSLFDTPEPEALQHFRAAAERIAAATIRETGGASYELYARRFSKALEPYIARLNPDARDQSIKIAAYHGYVEDADDESAGFGPGLCSFSGIDEDYCHCGGHP